MKREAEFFSEQELDLVFIAKKLREAQAIESLLTAGEMDYLVEVDHYAGGVLFRRELAGAFFYVAPRDRERARGLITQGGYRPFEPEAGPRPGS